MDARRKRLQTPRRRRAWERAAVAGPAAVVVMLTSACGAFAGEEESSSTIEVDREDRQEGDVEGNVGDALEVYGIEASVESVERVETYSELDNRGYIEATITMENTTDESIDYDRSDWRLEKPDGETSNTANVSAVTQLTDDTLPGGESVEGTVVYTAGDLDGQFALTFSPASLRPDDDLQVERGVWVFESAPGDAG